MSLRPIDFAALRARFAGVDELARPPIIAGGLIVIGLAACLYTCRPRDAEGTRTAAAVTDAAATIATTQVEEADALGAVVEESHERIGKIEARTRGAVARVRDVAATPVVAAAPSYGVHPDIERVFYGGVCGASFYRADPLCDGRRR